MSDINLFCNSVNSLKVRKNPLYFCENIGGCFNVVVGKQVLRITCHLKILSKFFEVGGSCLIFKIKLSFRLPSTICYITTTVPSRSAPEVRASPTIYSMSTNTIESIIGIWLVCTIATSTSITVYITVSTRNMNHIASNRVRSCVDM